MNKKFLVVILMCLGAFFTANAQKVGIKTNLLYDLSTTVNLGVEVAVAPQWTLDISGNLIPWKIGSKSGSWKHTYLQPEARWWADECFSGHFVGVHALGGVYELGGLKWMKNVVPGFVDKHPGIAQNRYKGWGVGAGVAYGYAVRLAKHWNFEAELGLGYFYFNHDTYDFEGGQQLATGVERHYVGPTKLGVTFMYLF